MGCQHVEQRHQITNFDRVKQIVIFNGSPRMDGNTATLLNLIAKGARDHGAEVKFYTLFKMRKSLIEGIANGFAEKGLVDRMLLSMPLNSGMSGGPILNAAGEVVGTNVSVMWLSNSLSFGVPAEKIAPLLARPLRPCP